MLHTLQERGKEVCCLFAALMEKAPVRNSNSEPPQRAGVEV